MRPAWMFVIFTILINASFANAFGFYSIEHELSLQQILENKASCVKEISGNKIYLKTDGISISEKGVYVLLNELGDLAFIPMLCTDAAGCFIQVGLTSGSDLRTGDWANSKKRTCPGCGTQYFNSCPNKDCPLKKKN